VEDEDDREESSVESVETKAEGDEEEDGEEEGEGHEKSKSSASLLRWEKMSMEGISTDFKENSEGTGAGCTGDEKEAGAARNEERTGWERMGSSPL
jgi:hypothetical protein